MTSLLAPIGVEFDPLKDKSYQQTRLGRSVADFLAWKALSGAAENTLRQYEYDLARGCLMYPDKDISQITGDDMIHIAQAFKPGGRRSRIAAYRAFFKWAIRARKIKANPCDALPDIRPAQRKVYDIFGEAEITALTSLPIRDGALMQLMFDTGARKGDCQNLQLRHWRRDTNPLTAPHGMIVFHAGKGGKDRQVPATAELARKLAELEVVEGLRPNDYLWYTRGGRRKGPERSEPIGSNAFQDWWARCLADAGARQGKENARRQRNPHLTRHTFATRFLRARGRMTTLQMILGHASIQTTVNEYGHLDNEDVAADMVLMESSFNPDSRN